MKLTVGNRERYVKRTCSLCNEEFHDCTTTYCRPCTNAYVAWRLRQKRAGLPTTIVEYRRVTNQPRLTGRINNQDAQVDIPTHVWDELQLKECPICLGVHRNPHSIYCPTCKSRYQVWAREQRELFAKFDGERGRARPTIEEFRCMVFDMRN